MHRWIHLAFVLLAAAGPLPAHAGHAVFTVVSANLSDNTSQAYEEPGIRILQALSPDVVGFQEFSCKRGSFEDLARRILGPDAHVHREKGARLPNGIASRFPILAAGQWEDPLVKNRNFAWATLDVPGPIPLHVVSVHLLHRGARLRARQAQLLLEHVRAQFPKGDYVVLCGDLNLPSRDSETLEILSAVFVDDARPADQNGNENTNVPRNRPYDYVLPNRALAPREIPTVLAGQTFPTGLVFDTRLWNPPPPPAEWEDSARNLQHLPVVKTFRIPLAP